MLERYAGQSLKNTPHIAVLGSCKVGNFVVTTPLLKGLREQWPQATVDFYGSKVTADFERAHAAVDWRISWDEGDDALLSHLAEAVASRRALQGGYDLAINCDGFNPVTQVLTALLRPRFVAGGSLVANLRDELPAGDLPAQQMLLDPAWDSPAFVERYQAVVTSNYIAEIICKSAFIDCDSSAINVPWQAPGIDAPDLLIHCSTTRAAKIWPAGRWLEVMRWCDARGVSVGMVGSPPKVQADLYHAGDIESVLLEETRIVDLRGKTSLIQLAGLCRKSRAMVSVDAGPMHIAAAVGCDTLGIFGNDADGVGASPMRLWMPRGANVSRTVSEQTCTLCVGNRYRNNGCIADTQRCMDGVDAAQVIEWLQARFSA
ncbi:glycosyltransferase family 9 protein [Gammaproteobacteria bacterium]|nr:glycosyltransferase family 9 protein [Gammaproteobacteria bacterium]